jgi:hypothetical protein
MSTAIIESSAKTSYYQLLMASYWRAQQVLDEMLENPEKFSPERMRDTAQYLAQLKKEMDQYRESLK